MIDNILTNYGYGILKKNKTKEEINNIIEELTVKPNNNFLMNHREVDDSFCVCLETNKYLYLPKYYGLKKFGLPNKISINIPEQIELKFNGNLLDNQKAPVEEYLKNANNPKCMGGILQLPPGSGKTVMALYISCKLKVKTLIIVHKDFLLNQWKERIEEYLPGARIGLLKQKQIETKGFDITIASLHSLSMKEYDENTFCDFGLVIIDECHHIAAQVFSKALLKINFQYALGLSATVNRKDGLSKVFKWFIGDVVYKITKKEISVTTKVEMCTFKDTNPIYKRDIYLFNGKVNMARMINNVAEYKPRQEYVVDKLLEILEKESNRNVIMLSDRRKHLEDIKKLISKRDEVLGNKTGLYIGGMKNKILEESKEKQIILGTYNMVSEGFDLPKLDTLFLLTSKGDVQQSVGRIQRKHVYTDEDNIPLIVDFVDDFSVFHNQSNKRKIFYKKMNYMIYETLSSE